MALIRCPDCGRDISERAGSCPFCGCPISELLKSGETIKIKLLPLVPPDWAIAKTLPGPGDQKVSISSNGRVIWTGRAGDVAELFFSQPTSIDIKYHMSAWRNGAKGSGIVDPTQSKTYVIFAQASALTVKLDLRPVDTLDS